MDAPGRPPNGTVTGGTDLMHDAAQDLCTIISANYTCHKSSMKLIRMPVSFTCKSARLSAHTHGEGGCFRTPGSLAAFEATYYVSYEPVEVLTPFHLPVVSVFTCGLNPVTLREIG